MPTYDYRCPNGHDFEHFYRKISEATPELACPQCGAMAARRVSGGAGLVFKGSGFYLTDYGKNAHRKSGGSDGASGGSESKSDSGGDAKGSSSSESAKTDGANTAAKSEPSSTSSSKGESSKTSDTSTSSKPKSGDSK